MKSEAEPGPDDVVRGGVVLRRCPKTEPAPPERVAEMEARHAAGRRLFEPGVVPPVQGDRNRAQH